MGMQRIELGKNIQGCFNDVENVLISRMGGGFVGVNFFTLQNLHMYYCVFIKSYVINNKKLEQKEQELFYP